MKTITLLTETGTFDVQATEPLWLSAADLERATGWTLKPEGLCRDEACIPLPATAIREDRVDVEAFWQRLDAPIVHDDARSVWVLGASAQSRNAALAGTVAPDFTLPDLEGRAHTLSSLRGRKVFLATWASW